MSPRDPVVEVGYLDADRGFRSVDGRGASGVAVRLDRDAAAGWRLTAELQGLGGLALDATVSVRGGPGERWAAWSVSVQDRTPGGLRLTHVAFPWIAVARQPSGAILQPFGAGRLISGSSLDALEADTPAAFEFVPRPSIACTTRATPSPSSWPPWGRGRGSSWQRVTRPAGPSRSSRWPPTMAGSASRWLTWAIRRRSTRRSSWAGSAVIGRTPRSSTASGR